MYDFAAVSAQIKPKLGCVADNLALIDERIRMATAQKADLIIFPELLSGRYSPEV